MVERDALQAYGQMEMLGRIVDGRALTIVPVLRPDGSWTTPAQMRGAQEPARKTVLDDYAALGKAYRDRDPAGFGAAADRLTQALRAVDPAAYPAEADLDRELFYYDFNAFGKAWIESI